MIHFFSSKNNYNGLESELLINFSVQLSQVKYSDSASHLTDTLLIDITCKFALSRNILRDLLNHFECSTGNSSTAAIKVTHSPVFYPLEFPSSGSSAGTHRVGHYSLSLYPKTYDDASWRIVICLIHSTASNIMDFMANWRRPTSTSCTRIDSCCEPSAHRFVGWSSPFVPHSLCCTKLYWPFGSNSNNNNNNRAGATPAWSRHWALAVPIPWLARAPSDDDDDVVGGVLRWTFCRVVHCSIIRERESYYSWISIPEEKHSVLNPITLGIVSTLSNNADNLFCVQIVIYWAASLSLPLPQ